MKESLLPCCTRIRLLQLVIGFRQGPFPALDHSHMYLWPQTRIDMLGGADLNENWIVGTDHGLWHLKRASNTLVR